jgi:excisionase family DNA binding protein
MAKKQRPKPLAVTLTDAATMLGVSRSTIYRLLESGQLSGKKAHITRDDTSSYSEITLILVATVETYLASLPDFVSAKGAGEFGKPSRHRPLRAVK